MARRAKCCWTPPKKLKACQGRGLSKDRISELPDDIIVYILSLLTMKEAGRLSVLSKRWRYVWTHIPVLNFDASDTLVELMLDKKLLQVEKPRYLRWVNQVVSSYKGPTIDEFTVQFDITVTSRHSIDNWVKFAMEKRVKRLELDFSDELGCDQRRRCYTFRCSSFCNSLTSLRLLSVNVSGDILENFLNNCPQLEFVKVRNSNSLVNLKVVSASISLKYLEIYICFSVKHIEISAPNLVSFRYFGPKISVPFKNTPKLAEVSIGGDYAEHLVDNFSELSVYLCQLKVLMLDVQTIQEFNMKYIKGFPLCTMLKQLEVTVDPGDGGNLFGLSSMIKACPFLDKFVLKLTWVEPYFERNLSLGEAFPHYNLKIIKIVGFIGHAIDLEFALHLIENAVSLEKIIIDTCVPVFLDTPWEFERRKPIPRKQAKQLRAKLKSGTDLVFV